MNLRMRCRRSITIALVHGALLMAWLTLTAPAAVCGLEGGRFPVKIVEGRLVVACDLVSPSRRFPVNLFIEYETPCGLQLHNRAAAALRIETDDGRTIPFRIQFPGFSITVPSREHGDEEFLDEFTKYHSVELGENAVVGVIGAEILDDYLITFDLAAGEIELQPSAERTGDPPAAEEGAIVTPITIHGGMAWLPIRYADGQPAAMGIGTARYDSTIDWMVCDELGRPAGNIGSVRAGDIDLSEFVALRPEDVILVHPDGVAGVLGLGFLRHFRVEVDRENRFARLTPTAPADFPESDLAYFRALASEEADPVEAFLDECPSERLSAEAAEQLLTLRLEEDADGVDVARAIHWVNDTAPEDLRATRAFDLMEELSSAGYPDYVITAGELGIEAGRDDRYPNAVHEIHSKLGDVLLGLGEGRRAWKHLLSAAFGIPEDGMVNLNLGRYYEQEGRYTRAYSRYVQACIKPESGPQAVTALMRVQEMLPDEDAFSVDLVDRLVGGKVRSFGAATHFEATDETFAGRVALVEFFTNANLGDGDRGAIGGALGNQGLISHFQPEHVAFLSYHLNDPSLDPMVNEVSEVTARELGVKVPAVQLVNGTPKAGAARWRDAEAIYNDCRKTILDDLLDATPYELSIEARIEDGVVSGTLVAKGPERKTLNLYLVLAEAGVLFPGKSEVIVHRMVARAALTESARGVRWAPVDGKMEIPFTADLAELTAANEAYLQALEARGEGSTTVMSMRIDPAQVRLVAFLRSPLTAEVIQAIQVTPTGPDEPDSRDDSRDMNAR